MYGQPTYELLINKKTLYLKPIETKSLEYKVTCHEVDQKLIRIEALQYIGRMKMHVSRIINFDEKLIGEILPECFV